MGHFDYIEIVNSHFQSRLNLKFYWKIEDED